MLETIKGFFRKEQPTYISTISKVILDNAFSAIVLFNRKGDIIEWNKSATNLFGWDREEVLGKKAISLFPGRYKLKHAEDINKFLSTGESEFLGKTLSLKVRHNDGFEFDVSARINHVVTKGEDVFVAIFSDKSIFEKIEEERKEHAIQLIMRIRNIMNVVQSIIRQTMTTSNPEEIGSVLARIFAIDKAVNVLSKNHWHYANLYDLVYANTYIYGSHDRFDIKGGRFVSIEGNNAISFALMMHELVTNSVKHGALRKDSEGKVSVTWEVVNNSLVWHWLEVGGPPVKIPEDIGFGLQFVKRAFTGQGETIIEYLSTGFSCTLVLKLPESGKI